MRISDWSSDVCSSDLCDRKIDDADVDWSHLRNWGSESERSDAKNCFYPIMVKDGAIVGFGDVCPDEFHPKQTEVIDGISYVYQIIKQGGSRRSRLPRKQPEGMPASRPP